MESVSAIPVPRKRAGVRLRARLVASASRCMPSLPRWPPIAVDLTMTIGGVQRPGGGEAIQVVQPHARLDAARHPARRDARRRLGRDRRGAGGGAGLGGDVVRRAGGRPAQGRRPARRAVARPAQRGDDARPVQDAVPGRDRRGLRADRLPAVQRRLRPPAARGAAAVGARRLEPASTTARSRASSTRSRRSTSPPSPATCRWRRPSWATSWSGSRRRPSSSPPTGRCGCSRRPACRPAWSTW